MRVHHRVRVRVYQVPTCSKSDGLVQQVTEDLLKYNSNTIIQFGLLLFWCYVKVGFNTEWWASVLLGDEPQVPCSYIPLFSPSSLQVIQKLRSNHLEFDSWYNKIFHTLMEFISRSWILSIPFTTSIQRLGTLPLESQSSSYFSLVFLRDCWAEVMRRGLMDISH